MTGEIVWFLTAAFALGLACGLWRAPQREFPLLLLGLLRASGWALLILAAGTVGLFAVQIAARLVSNSGPVRWREVAVGSPVLVAIWVVAVSAWALAPIVAGAAIGLALRVLARRSG